MGSNDGIREAGNASVNAIGNAAGNAAGLAAALLTLLTSLPQQITTTLVNTLNFSACVAATSRCLTHLPDVCNHKSL